MRAWATRAEPAPGVRSNRRTVVHPDELLEPGEAELERPETGCGAAQRPGHDERVAGTGAASTGYPPAPAKRSHAQGEHGPGAGVPADQRNARLVQTLVELEDVVRFRLARRRQRDEQSLRLGGHRGQIAQVYGSRLVAEIAPGRPFASEVDALHQHVLRGNAAVGENRPVVSDPLCQTSPLELPQEPELTQLAEPQGRRRRRGRSRSRSR